MIWASKEKSDWVLKCTEIQAAGVRVEIGRLGLRGSKRI